MPARHPCDSILVSHLPNIRYLTGFTGSSACAVITPRKKLFFTDSRYGIQASREVRGFELVVANGPPLAAACHYLRARRIKTGVLGYEGAHLSCRELRLAQKILKGARFRDKSGCIEEERTVKTGREVASIRKAARIADGALDKLRRLKVVGKSEAEIAWFLERCIREAGSERLPFEVIVASGPRSAMPHGAATGRVIRKNELIVIDVGARAGGYCSDITRTFSTGRLSRRQREIYQTVLEAQRMAIQAVAPGASCSGIDRVARGHIEAAGYGEEFGHSLGHGIGLEAHEKPVLSSRSGEVLSAGMTFTIEPGIYLERTGGVRIEDSVLVGKRGAVMLTEFPRDLITLG